MKDVCQENGKSSGNEQDVIQISLKGQTFSHDNHQNA